MKKLLFAALLLISSSVEANWIRIASSNPITGNRNIFLGIYLHDGPLDTSLPNASRLTYYLAVVYDLEMIAPRVYVRKYSITKSVARIDLEAKRFALSYERRKRLREIAEGYRTQDPSEDEKEEP